MDDDGIIDLYLRRDEAAIARTAERFGPRLRSLALAVLDDPGAAEECENDTYLRAWGSIPPNEPRGRLYPYLARITRRLALNVCRDRGRLKRSANVTELTAELEQCLPAPGGDAAEDIALADTLNRFLAGLTAEKRRIFLRRYWFADPVADIAARFGITESKVCTTLHRCRRELRRQLEREGYII